MFDKNKIIEKIKISLSKKEEISPFLFVGDDLEKVNFLVNKLIEEIFSFFAVNKNNLFKLLDNNESIKVEEIRNFISRSFIGSDGAFQIFFIENISRLTESSSNAMLKFLEEPGIGNIIFLTNNGENKILETVLSRVNTIYIDLLHTYYFDEHYYSLIDNFVKLKDFYIFSYFFREKLEKKDYINFLKTFLYYIRKNLIFLDLATEVYETLNLIINSNIIPKYHVDKILMKLKN